MLPGWLRSCSCWVHTLHRATVNTILFLLVIIAHSFPFCVSKESKTATRPIYSAGRCIHALKAHRNNRSAITKMGDRFTNSRPNTKNHLDMLNIGSSLIFERWLRTANFDSFSEREHEFAICCRPSVCRLQRSCALLSRLKFSAMFLLHLARWPSVDIHVKFYGDRPRGTPGPGALKTRGVAKYSDFGHIDGYISETVQDRR